MKGLHSTQLTISMDEYKAAIKSKSEIIFDSPACLIHTYNNKLGLVIPDASKLLVYAFNIDDVEIKIWSWDNNVQLVDAKFIGDIENGD